MSLHETGRTIARQLGTASDIALIEGGLLQKYLAERGHLLPADEQFLLTIWSMAERGIYEVLSTTSDSCTVRNTNTFLEHTIDLTHDDPHDTGGSMKVGSRFCGFVSSDSIRARIFGHRFHVPVGNERQVQAPLDDGTAEELAEWVGRLFAPPRIVRGNTGLKSILAGLKTDDLDVDTDEGHHYGQNARQVRGELD